jgi:SWI/SNF-related matrix-associated actin-dependent regulator of chromatin subfamily A member 5
MPAETNGKIKNEQTQLGQAVMALNTQHRLLLTGTPLQNNLRELWALLHWLYPYVFTPSTSQIFSDAFDLQKSICDQNVLDASRRLLDKVMLRRLKADVSLDIPPKTEMTIFVPLAPMQSFWYKRLLSQLDKGTLAELFKRPKQTPTDGLYTDVETESNASGSGSVRRNDSNSALSTHSTEYDSEFAATYRLDEAESNLKVAGAKNGNDWQKMMNLLMQLRKCCDHVRSPRKKTNPI